MITDIQKISCHEKGIDKGVLVFAVFVEYLAFLARENIVSLGDDCSEMLDEISLIQGNTDSCMVNGTVKKYLCWNNILSVLIDQEGLTEISDRIVISCQTYRQLLRLKAAFISFDMINGMNTEIDMQLIDEIVKRHCLCGYLCKWYARMKYKRKLKEALEKSQDFACADFYGIPKNPFLRFFDDKIY